MKFTSLFATLALAATAFAQEANIISPTAGQAVAKGSSIIVRVTGTTPTADSIQNSCIIVFTKCTLGCLSPLNDLGTVLYNGVYNPTFHITGPGPARTVYQDITVTLPPGVTGNGQISVLHPNFTPDGSQVTYDVNSIVVSLS